MKLLIDSLRKIKIGYRLFIVFLISSLCPTMFIGTYAYIKYTESIQSKLCDAYGQAVYLLQANLLAQIGGFQQLIDRVSSIREFQKVMSKVPENKDRGDEETLIQMKEIVEKVSFLSTYLKNHQIIDRNGNIVYDLGYDDITESEFAEIIKRIEKRSPEDDLQYIRTYRGTDKIVLGRKLYSLEKIGEHIGYELIYIDEKMINDKVFSDVSFGEGSNIMLIDSAGYVISAQDKSMLGSSLKGEEIFLTVTKNPKEEAFYKNIMIDGTRYLLVSSYNASLDDYLVATIPYSYISNETKNITTSIIVVVTILAVMSMCASMLVYASIMQPINKIIAACRVRKNQDIEALIEDKGKDELGLLCNQLNNMKVEIKGLEIEKDKEQVQKRQLELEVLQYQINPHFLFNTLNSLKYVAQINDVPVLEQGLESLTLLLQHTLVAKKEVVSIKNELDNLEHYFRIQSIRYGGAFEVEYQIEEDTLEYIVPRFLLQPLAENAIIHGIGNADHVIAIVVKSRFVEDKYVELLVKDDGAGFEVSKMENSRKERFSGIGVENVNQRIKLQYGKEYGLEITSKVGVGTTCRIRIPK